eukprot:TRINITY_DN16731_c0_g1_i1.p2 TRINITY_DN16731_c0_g1~~TRINITY_DN16731_c0_g1_i1.p2  ORF type:complete len:260 (-),score=47.76 TRINITY_DN16731_c0_g1_i1:1019-1798(-)
MKHLILALSILFILFSSSSCTAIFGTSIYAVLSTQTSKTSPYVLHELNTGLRMEIEQVTFTKSVKDLVSDISEGQVIVYGTLSTVNSTATDVYKFNARTVYLSLPPVNLPSPLVGYNQYFKAKQLPIVCVRFPCNNIKVDQLNGDSSHTVAEVNLKTLDVPANLYQDWANGIILNGSSIALGEIVQIGEVISLEVHDVFVKVPVTRRCGPVKQTSCPQGQVAAKQWYQRRVRGTHSVSLEIQPILSFTHSQNLNQTTIL